LFQEDLSIFSVPLGWLPLPYISKHAAARFFFSVNVFQVNVGRSRKQENSFFFVVGASLLRRRSN